MTLNQKYLANKINFSLSISTGILLKEVDSLPYIVVRGIHINKAKKLINQTTYPECYSFF